ncbi:condensation protein, partial [Agrobacterium rhizogenes]|nr:condensation protein [Rhizobium rhizogenes]
MSENPTLKILSPGRRALFEKRIERAKREPKLSISVRQSEQVIPVSMAQERLWLLEHLETLASSYNLSTVVRISGTLRPATLERSFTELVNRHEALRTRFSAQQGSPVQVIDP